MQHSLLYAKSIALLLEEVQSPSDLTMVRSGLLRVRRFSRSLGLTLEIADDRLVVDSVRQQRPIPALQRLTLAMVAHGVARINISAGAMPSELLKVAIMLAKKRASGSQTPGIFDEIRDASLWSVQLYPVARAVSAEEKASYATDVGADVLIEQLLKSDSMDVRRACFDALAEVRCGTTQLLTMLDHEQWFVVRNAACLLGAFNSRSSEPELTATLNHSDDRVRAAVITALLQLDTPSSRATVRNAIRDPSAEVRRRAVRGFLAEPRSTASADKLLQALERETELDVQIEFLYALGTLATPDAVQKLIRLCSMDGRYRPADFRIAAAEALASARLGAAVPLLRMMLKDPDVHARAAARHLIRAVS